MKPSDFTGLFKKNTVSIESINNPFDDYYVIQLSFPDKLTWEAGEHGAFLLPDNKVSGKPFRAFSVASIPSEKTMTIATRANAPVSSFKKELFSMKKGDRVTVLGPFGWFKVKDETSPIVLIATGIGITPMRALAYYLSNDASRPIHLIYSSPDKHLFKSEFDAIAKQNRSFQPVYTASKEETIARYVDLAEKYQNEAFYYVSGKRNILKGTIRELKNKGIKRLRIITDPYFGY
ncbi:FAD-dependent oxidoreductase [Alkalibacterium thalassium]|uniref:NAD(P)H-flavin reductase n=1 Tax=Alkalibacterium thalassium TaxID=426701 RepID=A0A1G9ABK7_9LACT|nr:FAD-dependent oxidoreductase [Alkalibacterium thalassium]SDK24749.1 NAD(P)H-flavin reductase [Alkalibacterium thalassium]